MVNKKLCSFFITLILWPYKLNAMLLMRVTIRAGKTVYFQESFKFHNQSCLSSPILIF